MKAFEKQVGGDHYKDMEIQPTEYCQRNRLNFCESAVVKYVSRHKSKGGRKDIEKAIHFLEMLLDIDYPVEPPKEVAPESWIDEFPALKPDEAKWLRRHDDITFIVDKKDMVDDKFPPPYPGPIADRISKIGKVPL